MNFAWLEDRRRTLGDIKERNNQYKYEKTLHRMAVCFIVFFLYTKRGTNKSLALYLILRQVEATPLFFTLEFSCGEDGTGSISHHQTSDLEVLGIVDGGNGVLLSK